MLEKAKGKLPHFLHKIYCELSNKIPDIVHEIKIIYKMCAFFQIPSSLNHGQSKGQSRVLFADCCHFILTQTCILKLAQKVFHALSKIQFPLGVNVPSKFMGVRSKEGGIGPSFFHLISNVSTNFHFQKLNRGSLFVCLLPTKTESLVCNRWTAGKQRMRTNILT